MKHQSLADALGSAAATANTLPTTQQPITTTSTTSAHTSSLNPYLFNPNINNNPDTVHINTSALPPLSTQPAAARENSIHNLLNNDSEDDEYEDEDEDEDESSDDSPRSRDSLRTSPTPPFAGRSNSTSPTPQ